MRRIVLGTLAGVVLVVAAICGGVGQGAIGLGHVAMLARARQHLRTTYPDPLADPWDTSTVSGSDGVVVVVTASVTTESERATLGFRCAESGMAAFLRLPSKDVPDGPVTLRVLRDGGNPLDFEATHEDGVVYALMPTYLSSMVARGRATMRVQVPEAAADLNFTLKGGTTAINHVRRACGVGPTSPQ